MGKLRTTTWIGRNAHLIEEAKNRVDSKEKVNICVIGVGGMTHALLGFHPQGQKNLFSAQQKAWRFAIRIIDNICRKYFPDDVTLSSPELGEIIRVFRDKVLSITVVDNDSRVLNSVEKQYGSHDFIDFREHDIQTPFPEEMIGKFDIVIAYHVLELLKSREIGELNLHSLLGEGGFLSKTPE